MSSFVKFTSYTILALSLSACLPSISKNTVNQGDIYLQKQQYDQAIVEYKKLNRAQPENIDAKMNLVKALSTSAISLYEEADTLAAEDLDQRIILLNKANEHREQARIEIANAMVIEPIDPNAQAPITRPTQLLLPLDSSMDYSSQIKLYQETLSKQEKFATKKLAQAEASSINIKDNIDAVLTLVALGEDGPIKAYEAFRPYKIHARYMTSAQEAKTIIEQAAIKYYETQGLREISKNQFTKAAQYFVTAQTVVKNAVEIEAGNLSITAKEQINSRDYMEAFKTLNKIAKIHPESSFLSKHMNKISGKLMSSYLTKADRLAKSQSTRENIQAFEIYQEAQPIADKDLNLKKRLDKAIKSLQGKISNDLTSKAVALNNQSQLAYPKLVNQLLSNAYQFSATAPDQYKLTAAKMRALSEKLNGFKVAVSSTGEGLSGKPSLLKRFNNSAHKELLNNKPEGIQVSKLENTNDYQTTSAILDNNSNLKDTELVFLLDITKHNVRETGRNKAKHVTSQYVASYKKIDNPNYETNKIAIDKARQKLAEVEQLEIEALQQCKQMKAAKNLAIECSYGSLELENAHRNVRQAEAEFEATPAQIEDIVTADYRYSEYTVKVHGQITAQLKAVDRRSNNIFKLAPITVSVDKSGYIRSKIKDSDVNGYKNGETNIPNLKAENIKLEQEIAQHTAQEIAKFVKDHDWKRHCLQGKALSLTAEKDASAEAYLQCIEAGKDRTNAQQDIAAAQKALNTYFGFDINGVGKFAQNAESSEFTKETYTITTSDINASMHRSEQFYASKVK